MSKLKTNMLYQTIYQVLAICIPLITSPYLSRVLGATGLGIYAYNNSIVAYFIMFALLGVSSYGMRAIAQSNGKEETSKTFWSIYAFQLISSGLAVLAYVFFCVVTNSDNRLILWIQTIYVFSEMINISWLFFGLEKYKTTVIRNIIVKILTVVSIFLFVRDSGDLLAYILILAVGTLISNAVLWLQIKDCIEFSKITFSDVIKHIKPNLLLFIPVAAASIYHAMDKTMLGIFSDEANSGYYYNADKLVSIPLTVITACSNVFMSRISAQIGSGHLAQAKVTQSEAVKFNLVAICAIAFGISAVAKEFVPIFFGAGYEPCITLIYIFAWIIVIKAVSTHIRASHLIPEGRDKIYVYSTCTGAVVNLIANYILLKTFALGAKGATYGTLIAEFAVLLVQVVIMGAQTKDWGFLREIFANSIYIIFGFVMFAILWILTPLLTCHNVLVLLIKIAVGATVYLVECGLYWLICKKQRPAFVGSFFGKFNKKVKENE